MKTVSTRLPHPSPPSSTSFSFFPHRSQPSLLSLSLFLPGGRRTFHTHSRVCIAALTINLQVESIFSLFKVKIKSEEISGISHQFRPNRSPWPPGSPTSARRSPWSRNRRFAMKEFSTRSIPKNRRSLLLKVTPLHSLFSFKFKIHSRSFNSGGKAWASDLSILLFLF